MTSLYHSNEHPTETTYSTKRIYSDYPTIQSDKSLYDFENVTLSQTLALIKYIGQCGYSEFDTVHIVLARLRNAIIVLLKRCVRANREEYSEFIYALLKSFDVVMEKLVVRSIKECCQSVKLTSCHLVIKEAHSLVELIYSLTNPLNLPRILTEEYGLPTQHGLSVSSLQTNYLLEALHQLQLALAAHFETLDLENVADSAVNITPLKLYSSILLYTLEHTSKIITTLTSNAVPTNVIFLYFRNLLQSKNVQITDIEHFENFIAHFQSVHRLAMKLKHTPLYDVQKNLIKSTFLLIISEFPLHPLTWCTPAQTVNYIQMFIDVYNSIYKEDLYIEQMWNPALNIETTVIRKEKNKIRIDNGHYKLHVANLQPLPVPEFVSVFDGPDTSTSDSPEYMVFSPRLKTQDVKADSTASEYIPDSEFGGNEASEFNLYNSNQFQRNQYQSSHIPIDKEYRKVYELNELVALDVKDARAEIEKLGRSRIFIHDKTCFKCKYVPWHKHRL